MWNKQSILRDIISFLINRSQQFQQLREKPYFLFRMGIDAQPVLLDEAKLLQEVNK